MATVNEAERRTYALAVRKEHYKRSFETYALEQLKVQTKTPGVIAPLDISKKPLQMLVQAAVNEQWQHQGYVRVNIVKGRQQGSSTYTQGLQFWKAATTRNYSALLIAQDDPTTSSIFEKARFYYQRLDPAIRPLIRRSNKREIVFADPEHKNPTGEDRGLNSRMDFQAATNINAATGTTRHGMHLSEVSKWKADQTDILAASIFPCIPRQPGTIEIEESTPFYSGGWFRERCDEARSGMSDRKFIFGPAYMEPDNQMRLDKGEKMQLTREEQHLLKLAAKGQPDDGVPPFTVPMEHFKWRRAQIIEMGDPRLYAQEYPTDYDSCWITFDRMTFNADSLYYQRRYLSNPIRTVRILPGPKVEDDKSQFVKADEPYCAIWQEPVKGVQYDIGADVALGVDGGDWSTAIVINRRTLEQVAEVHVQMDTMDFGTLLYWLGFFYNTAQIASEWNSVGVAVVNQLQRLCYPYPYYWRKRDGAVPILSRKIGWETNQQSKPFMVSLFRKRLNDAAVAKDGTGITIHSRVLHDELMDFIQVPWGNTFEYRADKGHDDLCMAAMIATVTSDDESFGRLDEGINKLDERIESTLGDIALVDRPFGWKQSTTPFASEMK